MDDKLTVLQRVNEGLRDKGPPDWEKDTYNLRQTVRMLATKIDMFAMKINGLRAAFPMIGHVDERLPPIPDADVPPMPKVKLPRRPITEFASAVQDLSSGDFVRMEGLAVYNCSEYDLGCIGAVCKAAKKGDTVEIMLMAHIVKGDTDGKED